jgi:hypothetical protein
MKQVITNYIKSYLLCQQYNIGRIKKLGQLYPIETNRIHVDLMLLEQEEIRNATILIV